MSNIWLMEDFNTDGAARFPLGQTVATPAALAALSKAGVSPASLYARHQRGDWGDALHAEDAAMNAEGVHSGDRLLSAYWLPTGKKVWVITEWDRSATTILLPEDY